MYFRRLNVYDLTGVTAFPPGFQMVSGDPNLRSYNSVESPPPPRRGQRRVADPA